MKKILVVEDDRFLADAYKLQLERSGFEARIALDGHEAMAALKSSTPQLIILDLLLPGGLDGFALLERFKKDPSSREIPVIIASNLGQKEDIERGMKLGASDFLVKSDLSMDEFIKKINTFVK